MVLPGLSNRRTHDGGSVFYTELGQCGVAKCHNPVAPLSCNYGVATAVTPFTEAHEYLPNLFCEEHQHSGTDNRDIIDSLKYFDSIISRSNLHYTACANPRCKANIQGDDVYYPACSPECAKVVAIFQNNVTMGGALREMSNMYMNNSVVDSSWKTYRTGIRAWLRFCFCVIHDHPNFAFTKTSSGSAYEKRGGTPPVFRSNTEEQLMDFFTWLSLEGSVKPDSAEGYVCAVKAAHLVWNGHPFESSAADFFRLSRVIKGLKKSIISGPVEIKEGITHDHFYRWFQLNDTLPRGPLGALVYSSHEAKLERMEFIYPIEALMICLWHFILRPDELIITENHATFATVSMICFFSPSGRELPLLAAYEDIGHVTLDLRNRKNNQSGSNAPLMSAADHDAEGRHFCAAWQLHRLVQYMRPDGNLKLFPLFPVKATTFVPALPGAPSVFNKSYTYAQLGAAVKGMMRGVLSCSNGDKRLQNYTAYSPRIGGSIALHEAGADGLTIRAIGQWRSDVYQLYLRSSRMRALEWSVRVSRGYKAVLPALPSGGVSSSRSRPRI